MSSYYPRTKDLTRTRRSVTADSPPSSPSTTEKNYRVRPAASISYIYQDVISDFCVFGASRIILMQPTAFHAQMFIDWILSYFISQRIKKDKGPRKSLNVTHRCESWPWAAVNSRYFIITGFSCMKRTLLGKASGQRSFCNFLLSAGSFFHLSGLFTWVLLDRCVYVSAAECVVLPATATFKGTGGRNIHLQPSEASPVRPNHKLFCWMSSLCSV